LTKPRFSASVVRGNRRSGRTVLRTASAGEVFTEDVIVRLPDDVEQRTLDLEQSQPVFEIWHVAYTAEDRPVEVCVHVMPGHLWTLRYGWDDDQAAGVH
jgi:GntR family transcriptional regulator